MDFKLSIDYQSFMILLWTHYEGAHDEAHRVHHFGRNWNWIKSKKLEKKEIVDWKVALMNASRRVSYASNASLDELSSYLDDIPVSQSHAIWWSLELGPPTWLKSWLVVLNFKLKTENKELSTNQKLVLFICTISFREYSYLN